MTTLQDIRTKVRRLTGRPSLQQISDEEIDEYINTFYLYDMPSTIRLFSQKSVFEFMTEANVAEYNLRTLEVVSGSVSVPAREVFINLQPPVYVAGYESFWSQDREQFFRAYPILAQIVETTVGNGTPGPYSITFPNIPVLQDEVTVGAIDNTETVQNCIDVPLTRSSGDWKLINTNTAITGTVDYLTGVMSVTFPNSIPTGNKVTFTAVPYQPNRPQALLYFDDIITLRPVPDQSYLVAINAFQRPTELLQSSQNPELKQWWQYLAYGASKKIFEDASESHELETILPAFREQERLVLRRTIVEQTNQRTATIYTEMTGFPYSNFNTNL